MDNYNNELKTLILAKTQKNKSAAKKEEKRKIYDDPQPVIQS